MASARDDAVQRLLEAGRRHSTAVVLFHAAVARQSGLTAVESKTLEIVQRLGPMTHADLVTATGLAPASVTGVVSRLELKGAARRLPHPGDARRVLIAISPEFAERNAARFSAFLAALDAIASDYTVEQLATITGFLDRAAQVQQQHAAELEGADASALQVGVVREVDRVGGRGGEPLTDRGEQRRRSDPHAQPERGDARA